MLLAALETEVAAYLEAHRDERDDDGHALVVRNGKGRTRKVTVGAGTIPVSAPRVNDRRTDQDGERRRFTSRILPPYMRRSPKVAEVLPVLYLRGLSTGDFREALAALLGDHAAGLSAMDGASFPRAPGAAVDQAGGYAAGVTGSTIHNFRSYLGPVGEPWRCRHCGEEVDAIFAQCWNCEAERQD